MLDNQTATLLNHVNEICRAGKYEVVEADDLLACFPRSMGMDGENLNKTLAYLFERGFLDIKYSNGGTYCLCPLPEGRMYSERAKETRCDVLRRRKEIAFYTACGAFVGAFLGSLVAWLFTLIF